MARVTLDLDATVQVEPLTSWMLQVEFKALVEQFVKAEGDAASYAALMACFRVFCAEAMPSWDYSDHRGRVPETAEGMKRLPLATQLNILTGWVETLDMKEERPDIGLSVVESSAPSAVDAVVPPGPARQELKRRLRTAKKAA